MTHQAHNQEVCDFFISVVRPFNGLIEQHTEDNNPKSHGITLNERLWGFFPIYAQLKAKNINYLYFILELTTVLNRTSLKLMPVWDRRIPYLVVAQAVLPEFVFFGQMHLPLKRQKRQH